MKRPIVVFLFFFLYSMVTGLSAETLAGQQEEPKILIVNSYHPGFEWTDHIVGGIKQYFDKAGVEARFTIEYMDTKLHDPEKIFKAYKKLFSLKYGPSDFDVVITTDNNAFDFMAANRDELFGKSPVIFCGVNNFEHSMLDGLSAVTGVEEDIDIKGTIDLALKLHRQTKTIAVVSDVTPTDRDNRLRLNKVKPQYEEIISFIELTGLTSEELKKSLQELDNNTVVLFFDHYRDRFANVYTLAEGIDILTRHCRQPVYTLWADKVRMGLLGGVVISGANEGSYAAEMAIKILNGQRPADINILREKHNKIMFDFSQLRRFKISGYTLPSGTVIVNEPDNFFYRYRGYVAGAFAFIAIQSGIIVFLVINMTRRKRAEQALHEAHIQHREIVKAANVGLWSWDLVTNNVNYSPEWKKQIGYEEDEISDDFQEWQSRVHPDDLGPTLEKVQKCIEQKKQEHSIEFRFRHKDGTYRWILAQAAILTGKDGTALKMRGSHIDITDVKLAEQALLEHRELMDFIIRHDPNAVAVYDNHLNYIYVSDRYKKDYKVEGQDLIGKHHYEVFPEMPQRWKDIHQRVLAGNIEHSEDDYFVRQDGSIDYNRWQCRPWYRSDGSIGGMITYTEVTTKRKLAEKALEESRKILNDTGKMAKIGGWEHDLVTRKATWTEALYDIVEIPYDQPIPGPDEHLDYYPAGERKIIGAAYQKAIDRHVPFDLELQFYTPGKKLRWARVYGEPVVENGKCVKLQGIFQDITERKNFELERERFLKVLESKNKELRSIVYVASHDLRTPLINISGFVKELSRHCDEVRGILEGLNFDTEKHKQLDLILKDYIPEAVDFVIAGTSKIQSLLDGLLSVSRVGTAAVEIEKLDMNEIVGQVLKTVKYKAREKAVSIEVDDLPCCMADASLVNQVFSNLVDNGIKYPDISHLNC